MFSFEGTQVEAGCPQDSRCSTYCLADDAENGCMPGIASGGAAGHGWHPLAGSRPANQRYRSAGSDSGPPAWSSPAPMCMLTKDLQSLQGKLKYYVSHDQRLQEAMAWPGRQLSEL